MAYDWAVGTEVIYRSYERGKSKRVRIVERIPTKRAGYFRFVIEFLDGDETGNAEEIAGTKIHGLWENVEEFDQADANSRMVSQYEFEANEEAAIAIVFDEIMPSEIADLYWRSHAVTVHDKAALLEQFKIDVDDLTPHIPHYFEDNTVVLSGEATLIIAEQACQVNPMPILKLVEEEEAQYRELAKRGNEYSYRSIGSGATTPQWEFEFCMKYIRPGHEILRAWCGHRAVSFKERLDAAEAEVQRLNVLVARLIDEFKENGNKYFAEIIEEVHENERITPENIRPRVERPLDPSEIPVRTVEVKKYPFWRNRY